VKFCPNCGAGVEPGAGSCESCGADLAAVSAHVTQTAAPPVVPVAAAPATVADLTPRQLRKEIRWGVFQGILLAAVIGLVVYLLVILLVVGAVSSGRVFGG
jgi:uncharacterized membrane protein YvbJ